jgi:type IX secretion system PorP/SprF family membrane protein
MFSKNNLFFLGFLLLFSGKMAAQDPHFSQFFAAPTVVNPALNGVFDGKYRISANYRDQWASILGSNPFRTYSVSTDWRFNTNRNNYLCVSGGMLRDQAGESNFSLTTGNLGLSYIQQLAGGGRHSSGPDQFLVVGFQGGFGQNTVDWSNLWFSRQFDKNAEKPDFTAGNGEGNQDNKNTLFPDMNAGLLYYAVFDENKYIYFGGAMHHINAPAISFLGNKNETLYRRWTGNIGGQVPISNQLSVLPAAILMKQGPAFQTNLGANIRYSNGDKNDLALRAGMFTRLGNKLKKGTSMDALIVVAMLELNRLTVGLSYDVNVSTLQRATNSRGAFEVSVQYFAPEHRRQRVVCPKF